MNILDKSRVDWDQFLDSNEKLKEELKAHGKSGATYLEKIDFL